MRQQFDNKTAADILELSVDSSRLIGGIAYVRLEEIPADVVVRAADALREQANKPAKPTSKNRLKARAG